MIERGTRRWWNVKNFARRARVNAFVRRHAQSFARAYCTTFFAVPERPRFIKRIEEETKVLCFEFAEIQPERLNDLPIANNLHEMLSAS
jgi:hypothetical protein